MGHQGRPGFLCIQQRTLQVHAPPYWIAAAALAPLCHTMRRVPHPPLSLSRPFYEEKCVPGSCTHAAAATPSRGAGRLAALAGSSARKGAPSPAGAHGAAAAVSPSRATLQPATAAKPAGAAAAGAGRTAVAAPAKAKPAGAAAAGAGGTAMAPPAKAKAAGGPTHKGPAGGRAPAVLLPAGGGISKPPKPRAGGVRAPKAAAKRLPTPPRSVLYAEEPPRSGGRARSGAAVRRSGGRGSKRGAALGLGHGIASQSASDAIEDPDLSMRDMLHPTQQALPARPSGASGLAAAAVAGAKIGAATQVAGENFEFGVEEGPQLDLRAGLSEEEGQQQQQQHGVPAKGARAAPQQAGPARQPRAASSKARACECVYVCVHVMACACL